MTRISRCLFLRHLKTTFWKCPSLSLAYKGPTQVAILVFPQANTAVGRGVLAFLELMAVCLCPSTSFILSPPSSVFWPYETLPGSELSEWKSLVSTWIPSVNQVTVANLCQHQREESFEVGAVTNFRRTAQVLTLSRYCCTAESHGDYRQFNWHFQRFLIARFSARVYLRPCTMPVFHNGVPGWETPVILGMCWPECSECGWEEFGDLTEAHSSAHRTESTTVKINNNIRSFAGWFQCKPSRFIQCQPMFISLFYKKIFNSSS